MNYLYSKKLIRCVDLMDALHDAQNVWTITKVGTIPKNEFLSNQWKYPRDLTPSLRSSFPE